ncbi:aldo/keto reductase [Salmonirosea aquatica]|uniref:NADP-dependent oxidoreductase domain-containing protein n=1 Tax=Salmonirosea aquatica TaxID=2654236 RepID=A0A7C9BHW6_9BACT|nr:hypothetical protein [Cytophagaceae bacterium SJW1-29]
MGVEKLILGTVQMGLEYGINNKSGQIRREDAFEILHVAHASGIDTLDTAEVYGNAHQLIGVFHRQNPNVVFKINTKLPANSTSSQYEERISRYLDELGVHQIETLMFHSYAGFETHAALLPVLEKSKSKGLFKYLGVSLYENSELAEIIRESSVDVIQLPFNVLDNLNQKAGLLEVARSTHKIIHTRTAFLQGLFFAGRTEGVAQELSAELETIEFLASQYGISVESLALGYCLYQPTIDRVLLGVDSVKQLERNIQASRYSLPEAAVHQINTIKVKKTNLLNPAKWPKKHS